MRAFTKSGKNLCYSNWSKPAYASCDVVGMKAKRDGKNIRVKWSNPKGKNSYYKIEYATYDKKGKLQVFRVINKLKTNKFVAKDIPKSNKKMRVFIVLYKTVNGRTFRSDSTWPVHNFKI